MANKQKKGNRKRRRIIKKERPNFCRYFDGRQIQWDNIALLFSLAISNHVKVHYLSVRLYWVSQRK